MPEDLLRPSCVAMPPLVVRAFGFKKSDKQLGSHALGRLASSFLLDTPNRKRSMVRCRAYMISVLVACAAWTASYSVTAATFANEELITIPDVGLSSPYPSTINVSGMTGVVSKVTVTLNQLTHTFPSDLDMLLVGPGGQGVLLMSDVGGGFGVNNVTVTLDDTGVGSLPDSGQIVTGIYKPTNVGAGDTFAAPAPAGPYNALLSAFNGAGPNGSWALYVVDDAPNDQGTIAGGWSLSIRTSAPNTPPSISAVADQTTPANTSTPPIAFTVGDAETPAASLVVSGRSSNPALVPNANIVFVGSGADRSLTISPAAAQSGSATITLTVTDAGGATASTNFALAVTGTPNAATFANGALLAIPDVGSGSPYPSTINVSGMTGVVSKVTVTLNQLTHTYPDDLDMLLVGPGGQGVLLMSDVGGGFGLNNVTLTLDDAGVGSLPDSAQIVTGIYKPTNVGAGDTFAAPAPTGPYNALLSAFNGTGPNGPWALYVVDDEPGDHGAVAGGWSLAINTAAPNAPPSISAVADQTTPANTPTPPIAFTVGDAETPAANLVVSGRSSNPALVPSANIVFGGSGAGRTATISPAAGQSGSATITLTVSDAGGATASTSFLLTVTGSANAATFANGALITIPDVGSASPYPSTINVSGMTGVV